MPANPTPQQVYVDLLSRYGQEVADAFAAAIRDLTSRAEIQRLTAAIAAGNIDEALAALHLDPAAYGPVQDALQRAFNESGTITAAGMPKRTPSGVVLVIRFDGRNPEAEAILRRDAGQLITRIDEETRQSAREVLYRGLSRGDNPRTTALDIVGRINRVTGKREGGLLGLSGPQTQWALSAADELTSGDPALMKNYLAREARDKRFDRSVMKAIREEKPVAPDIALRAVTQYRNRLLKLRGDTIGRVETLKAIQAAKHEAYRQAVASGQLNEAVVERVWDDVGDLRTRHSHRLMDGQKRGLNEPFVSPMTGARLMFPGDTSLGAPASEVVQCRCDCRYRIRFLDLVR